MVSLTKFSKGQGLVEVAIILVLVSVVIAGAIGVYKAAFENHMKDTAKSLSMGGGKGILGDGPSGSGGGGTLPEEEATGRYNPVVVVDTSGVDAIVKKIDNNGVPVEYTPGTDPNGT